MGIRDTEGIRGREEDEFKEEKIFIKLQYWRIYRKGISFMKKRK
jgi:hypothetical protein